MIVRILGDLTWLIAMSLVVTCLAQIFGWPGAVALYLVGWVIYWMVKPR